MLLGLLALSCRNAPGDAASTSSGVSGGGSPLLECPVYDPGKVPDGPADAAAVNDIGHSPGSFAVGADGAASYAIPIDVLPAAGGMQPSLSLSYNSNNPNGLVGPGFAIGGAGSAITRCSTSIGDDGPQAVIGLPVDRLCLDGLRLVATTGEHGATGAEYRTIPDTFVRVRAVGGNNNNTSEYTGPDRFVVQTKDGRELEYGTGPGSKTFILTGFTPATSIAAMWSLSTASDLHGNQAIYNYAVENNTQRPDHIRYGGTRSGRPHDKWVQFRYRPVPGRLSGYSMGQAWSVDHLLDSIEVGTDIAGVPTTVRVYRVDYYAFTDANIIDWRNQVSKVTECSGMAAEAPCKRPTVFEWTTTEVGFEQPVEQTAAAPPPSYPGNFDEEGSEISTPNLLVIDANGDGRDDLMFPDRERWQLATSRGGANAYALSVGTDAVVGGGCKMTCVDGDDNTTTHSCAADTFGFPVDYNGDDRVDILELGRGPSWSVRLSEGTDFRTLLTTFERPLPPEATDIVGNGCQRSDSLTAGKVVGDFNGDGNLDLLENWRTSVQQPDDWRMRHGTGQVNPDVDFGAAVDDAGFGAPIAVTMPVINSFGLIAIDLNSDGKHEVIGEQRVAGALPNKFFAKTFNNLRFGLGDLAFSSAHGHHRALVDINGDGLRDIVLAAADDSSGTPPTKPWKVMLNSGRDGFIASDPAVVSSPNGPLGGLPFATPARLLDHVVAIDYDADGREDLLVPWGAGPTPGALEITRYLLLRSTGRSFEVFDPRIALPHSVFPALSRRQSARALDADGDGLQDLLVILDGKFHLYRHKSAGFPRDAVTGIRDGRNEPDGVSPNQPPLTVFVKYKPMLDDPSSGGTLPPMNGEVYKKGNCYRTGQRCLAGARWVVAETGLDTGSTIPMREIHAYADARAHRRGQKWMGFGEHRVSSSTGESADVPVVTRSFYDNRTMDLSTQGPRLVERWQYGKLDDVDGQPRVWLRVERNTWRRFDSVPGKTAFSFASSATSEKEFPATIDQVTGGIVSPLSFSAISSSSNTINSIDRFGNVLDALDVYGGHLPAGAAGRELVQTLSLDYDFDESRWLIARPRGTVTIAQNANGTKVRVANFTYAPGTNLVSRAALGSPELLAIDYVHDSFGNITGRTARGALEPEARSSCTTFEPSGTFVYAQANSLGHTTYQKVHPRFGSTWATIDENGFTRTAQYDGLGRLVRSDDPVTGAVTHTEFKEKHGSGWLVGVRNDDLGSGASSEVLFDRMGHAIEQRLEGFDGEQRVRRQEYDIKGRLAATRVWKRASFGAIAPAFFYTYDSKNRLRSIRRPDDDLSVTRFEYDGTDTTTVRVRGGEFEPDRNRVTRNDRGLITSHVRAEGKPVEVRQVFHYDPFGELIRAEVAQRVGPPQLLARYEIDDYGRTTASEDPARGVTSTDVNGFGEPISSEDALGRQWFYTHDQLGRVTFNRLLQSGSSESLAETTFTYDAGTKAIGKLRRVDFNDIEHASSHVEILTYDARGLLRSNEHRLAGLDGGEPESLITSFEYDAIGRRRKVTFPAIPGDPTSPARNIVGYNYNGAGGQLSEIRSGGFESQHPLLWELKETDDGDRLSREAFGDNSVGTRVYDNLARIQKLETHGVTDLLPNHRLQSLEYSYNVVGVMSARRDNLQGHTEHYTYDSLDRLRFRTLDDSDVRTLELTYDELGNITSKSDVGAYTYDLLRPTRLATAGGQSYQHDAVGNQTGRPGGVVVTYNQFNLPQTITAPGGQTAYVYSGTGQRVRKITAAETTTYLPGYERHAKQGGAVDHRFFVEAMGRQIAVLRATTQSGATVWQNPLYLHDDVLGSTDLVTSNVNVVTTIEERRNYHPFGEPRHHDWSVTGPPTMTRELERGFTGHRDEPELGLTDMRGRIYDPKLGRFLTADPLVGSRLRAEGWNRYAYVYNNPLGYVDPSGFSPEGGGDWTVCFIGICIGGGGGGGGGGEGGAGGAAGGGGARGGGGLGLTYPSSPTPAPPKTSSPEGSRSTAAWDSATEIGMGLLRNTPLGVAYGSLETLEQIAEGTPCDSPGGRCFDISSNVEKQLALGFIGVVAGKAITALARSKTIVAAVKYAGRVIFVYEEGGAMRAGYESTGTSPNELGLVKPKGSLWEIDGINETAVRLPGERPRAAGWVMKQRPGEGGRPIEGRLNWFEKTKLEKIPKDEPWRVNDWLKSKGVQNVRRSYADYPGLEESPPSTIPPPPPSTIPPPPGTE